MRSPNIETCKYSGCGKMFKVNYYYRVHMLRHEKQNKKQINNIFKFNYKHINDERKFYNQHIDHEEVEHHIDSDNSYISIKNKCQSSSKTLKEESNLLFDYDFSINNDHDEDIDEHGNIDSDECESNARELNPDLEISSDNRDDNRDELRK